MMISEDEWNGFKAAEQYGMYIALSKRIEKIEKWIGCYKYDE